MKPTSTPYVQFPLCALSFGKDAEERLEHIFWYSALYAGRKLWAKLPSAGKIEQLSRWESSPLLAVRHFDPANQDHQALRFGIEHMGSTYPCFRTAIACHDRLQAFVRDYESRHGRDCLVRMKTDLLFEALKGTGIAVEELCVLIAVRSALGSDRFKRIGRETIRCRAMGYKSAVILAKELPSRQDGNQPLSDWKLRSLLEALHARKFFARCTYGRRITYYSTKFKNEALLSEVFDQATRRHSTHWMQRTRNQELTDAIRNRRATLAGKPLPAPHATGLPQALVVDPIDPTET
jgi:hypothetical protein